IKIELNLLVSPTVAPFFRCGLPQINKIQHLGPKKRSPPPPPRQKNLNTEKIENINTNEHHHTRTIGKEQTSEIRPARLAV
ncbi:MAG: hypothetical protein LBJ43_06450, partial [Propionibacteriaceae bacterium]|nr:hypothetical protein [Propionibacteriaceae bacterium]